MATTTRTPVTTAQPHDASTIDGVAFQHRGLALMQAQHPRLPAVLLADFFAAGAVLAVEEIAGTLSCAPEDAASWQRWLAASLLDPGAYRALFAAEDALTARRQQWGNFQADAHTTNSRVMDLNREMEGTKAYSHLSEAHVVEVKEKIEHLDQERVDVLRHQADLPGTGAIIEQALADARAHLADVQATLHATHLAHLAEVEDRWLQEGLLLLPSLLTLLGHAAYLDQSWQRLGEQPNREHGSGHLRERLLQAMRA